MPEITLFQCITKLIVTCAQQNKYGGIANVYQIFSKIGLFRHFKEKKLFGGCGSHTGRERSVFTVGGIGGQGMGLEVGIVHRARVVP